MTPAEYRQQNSMDLTIDEINEMVTIFKALGSKTRLRILSILTRSENLPVSTVSEMLSMSISRVSHHLSLLENLGFVEARQEGKQVFHYISDDCIIDIMRRARGHVAGD
ncbi:transcriptional regulator [Candidatus Thorarchaeota archaeon]|nr:MAG: transcriptional regulator [Candidatus Thorarchaeota archaeon]